jgi:hypothetical protein
LLPDALRESERNLRRYSFLTDVSVGSQIVNAHEVDIHVNTEDQWTTKPNISWNRVRGSRTLDIGIEEEIF